MAEEQQGQERSEQPTAKRLTEARKKGQVARSRELNTFIGYVGKCSGPLVNEWTAISGITTIMSEALSPAGDLLKQPELIPAHLMGVMMSALTLITPFLALTVISCTGRPCGHGWATV